MQGNWFVVQTQPHCEVKAKRHLVNQGFETYLPVYRRRIRHAGRTSVVTRPLFPGYLFVLFDPEVSRWRSINGTVGVRQILSDGERPRYLDEKIVAEIKAREDESGVIDLAAATFVRGQAVRVTEGPMVNIEGLFQDIRDESRVILLVSLLGRKVRLQVPAEAIEAA
ncbi:transcription termination/antitermination protein NusG [Undibacter mobilis]|uniref:Transcriptional activator RfaH n=1 Tax=Undibacter mobilis TaxID=2292256 RepID=A0A371B6H5_9BRAD|nr:transcription termination/antitermination NusG family protein [Undibacter mobilis]RDV03178.1 transcriptional activator RfaH [Undibacter mobilis]